MKEKLTTFAAKYGTILYTLVFVALYATMILHEAYFRGWYISHDSANYLREAANLLAGNGFNVDGLAGGQKHFAAWPVGYPALIALTSFIFRISDLYLASKVLTILSVALVMAVIAKRWGNRVVVASLFFFNPGVFEIFLYTWSESVFSVLLFCFCVCAYDTLRKPEKMYPYVLMIVTAFTAFTVRYFGAVCVVFMGGIFALKLFLKYLKKEKISHRSLLLSLSACGLSGVGVLGYLKYNEYMCGYGTGIAREEFNESRAELFRLLLRALGTEFKNMFFMSDTLPFKYLGGGIGTFCLLLLTILAILYGLRKKRHAALLFLLFAVTYDALFIAIRFFSTMDIFYYRFFAPVAGILFTGLVLLPEEAWVERLQRGAFRYLPLAASVFAAFVVVNLTVQDGKLYQTGEYEELKAKALEDYREIPANSVCLYAREDPEYLMLYFRPDVVFFTKTDSCYDSYEIPLGETVEEMLAKYADYAYICIAKDRVEEIAQTEVADCFRAQETEGKYIILPTGSR
ncbi:MAG: hypothetical protein IKO10_13935 [Lachnospiraceae bacterium]|nr:hypothetical protein [Lachnospiraceae bacterium]